MPGSKATVLLEIPPSDLLCFLRLEVNFVLVSGVVDELPPAHAIEEPEVYCLRLLPPLFELLGGDHISRHPADDLGCLGVGVSAGLRSEEHTSELQSR